MVYSKASETCTRQWLFPAAALVVGLLVGFVGKRVVDAEEGDGRAGVEEAREVRKRARGGTAVPVSTLRSSDTIEEIAEDRSAAQYGRLALWVLDADAAQMGEMFRRLREEEVPRRVLNVLMVQWARVDPRGAIEAARGTRQELTAWWAWGKCDAERALAAAQAEPKWLDAVLRGAGQSDPDRALALLEEYPEALSYQSIEGIVEGLAQSDPRAAAEFGRRHGQMNAGQIRTWARREPADFLAWCAEQPVLAIDYTLQGGLEAVAREHPERVSEFLASLPTGALRLEMLRTAVRELASSDVDRALALVGSEAAGELQASLYEWVGLELAARDVGRSIELFREVGHLQQSGTRLATVYPKGGGAGGSGSSEAWVRALAEREPRATMALVREVPGASSLERTVAERWVADDAGGFAEWLLDEPPGRERDNHIYYLANHLVGESSPDLVSATEWAASATTEAVRTNTLNQVISNGWRRSATAVEAERYFQSEEVPAAARAHWERWLAGHPGVWEKWLAEDEAR